MGSIYIPQESTLDKWNKRVRKMIKECSSMIIFKKKYKKKSGGLRKKYKKLISKIAKSYRIEGLEMKDKENKVVIEGKNAEEIKCFVEVKAFIKYTDKSETTYKILVRVHYTKKDKCKYLIIDFNENEKRFRQNIVKSISKELKNLTADMGDRLVKVVIRLSKGMSKKHTIEVDIGNGWFEIGNVLKYSELKAYKSIYEKKIKNTLTEAVDDNKMISTLIESDIVIKILLSYQILAYNNAYLKRKKKQPNFMLNIYGKDIEYIQQMVGAINNSFQNKVRYQSKKYDAPKTAFDMSSEVDRRRVFNCSVKDDVIIIEHLQNHREEKNHRYSLMSCMKKYIPIPQEEEILLMH